MDAAFDDLDDPLLQLGATVALASDRYSSLLDRPGREARGYPDVVGDLSTLQSQLQTLRERLGHLDTYNDFVFLLDHLAEVALAAAPRRATASKRRAPALAAQRSAGRASDREGSRGAGGASAPENRLRRSRDPE